jgi:hypothetical protein
LIVITIKTAETIKLKKISVSLGAEYPKIKELFTSWGMRNKTARFKILSRLRTRKNNLIWRQLGENLFSMNFFSV